jgi:hypothetical protein
MIPIKAGMVMSREVSESTRKRKMIDWENNSSMTALVG